MWLAQRVFPCRKIRHRLPWKSRSPQAESMDWYWRHQLDPGVTKRVSPWEWKTPH